MKRCRIHKNNRGDSLVLVIGGIAMLSLLGIVVLAKTTDNRAMKQAEKQAQESFIEADSTTEELTTALETIAEEAMETAFSTLLLEYSAVESVANPGETASEARNRYFSNRFTGAIMELFYGDFLDAEKQIPNESTRKTDALEKLLVDALGGTSSLADLDLSVAYDGAEVEGTAGEVTKTVRVRNVKVEYTANGSTTSITTDICINARVPDITGETKSGMTCEFSDFTIITDGNTNITKNISLAATGNLYVGQDLVAGGIGVGSTGTGALTVSDADKMLIREDLVVEDACSVSVTNSTALAEGQGIWANGIWVQGGSLSTNNVNVYVSDDLTVEGDGSSVIMDGSSSEYVGYSGNTDTSAQNHEKSSAITINTVSGNTILDFAGLNKLSINGHSYIRDDKWEESVEGILQGESIAYKDMQAMYLVPGDCLTQGYNPILNETTTAITDMNYKIPKGDGTDYTLELGNYVDTATKFKTRVANLEYGKATYVYLNLTTEKAAQYVMDYLASPMGTLIKNQINNLGSGSRIALPTNTCTKANAISYDGTNLTVHPAADTAAAQSLVVKSVAAKSRYGGLFTSLGTGSGTAPAPEYKLLQDRILEADAFLGMSAGSKKTFVVVDPENTTQSYTFVIHQGNLTINGDSEYKNLKGILLVNGTITITGNTNITGLMMATQGINVEAVTSVTKNTRAVEVLLNDSEVGSYFKGYPTGAPSSGGFLSSEAIEISFDNWKKN